MNEKKPIYRIGDTVVYYYKRTNKNNSMLELRQDTITGASGLKETKDDDDEISWSYNLKNLENNEDYDGINEDDILYKI